MQSPQELLDKLDKLLSEAPKPSLLAYDEDLRDRILSEKEFSKVRPWMISVPPYAH